MGYVSPDNINIHDSANKVPEELKIPKFNQSDRDLLHEKVVNYTKKTATKLCSIEQLIRSDSRR